MTYTKVKSGYYFRTSSGSFCLKISELKEYSELFHKLYNKENPIYGCFCDVENDNDAPYINCVLDENNPDDCATALTIKKKEECKDWKQIK